MDSTRFNDFYKRGVTERAKILQQEAGLSDEETQRLLNSGGLPLETANNMIENVVGAVHLPLGIAANFRVNGKDYAIPMAVEEPSIVAGASYVAKLARASGGFTADADEPLMIGQIQLVNAPEPEKAVKDIALAKTKLLELANAQDSVLIKLGGGARSIEAKVLQGPSGKKMIVIYLTVNVLDAMGANAVNTMAESIAPELEKITGGKVRFRIITNLAVKRLARAKAVWKKDLLAKDGISGEDVVQGVIDGWEFAVADPFRAATNNKGMMNGIDAVCIATGNDWRAVEAGAHAFATHQKPYGPLAKYYKNKDGDLVGEIELPIAVGTIGGSIRTNPLAQIGLKILGVKSARELAGVMAAVGLAQNFAALRALSAEGIQRGHMSLHAKNIAVMAGATGDLVDKIAKQLAAEKKVRLDRAKELLAEYTNK